MAKVGKRKVSKTKSLHALRNRTGKIQNRLKFQTFSERVCDLDHLKSEDGLLKVTMDYQFGFLSDIYYSFNTASKGEKNPEFFIDA